MKRRMLACLTAASIGLILGCAAEQNASRSAAPPGCPATASDMQLEALFGTWEARFEGLAGAARVQLARHPEYAGVRGTITRGGSGTPSSVAQLAGDVDEDGYLSLDESTDGRTISGVWLGELQAASCGKEFKGVWRNAADESTRSFVLTRTDNKSGK